MISLATLRVLAVSALLALAGCASTPGAFLPPIEQSEINELAAEIEALGPTVRADEAQRMAEIAYRYPRELAVAYEITDPPIVHNLKVNMGFRPRGLCYQWADDLQARMEQENFRTIRLHRAIANAGNDFSMDHSSLVVSAPDDDVYDGILLDPWRKGGHLFWSHIDEDEDFTWVDRREVMAMRIAALEAAGLPVPTAPASN